MALAQAADQGNDRQSLCFALTDPEFTGPFPDFAEHAAVQFLDEFLAERIALAAERPILRSGDVFLLGFIQLAAIRDIRGDQFTRLFRRERRGMRWLIE